MVSDVQPVVVLPVFVPFRRMDRLQIRRIVNVKYIIMTYYYYLVTYIFLTI